MPIDAQKSWVDQVANKASQVSNPIVDYFKLCRGELKRRSLQQRRQATRNLPRRQI